MGEPWKSPPNGASLPGFGQQQVIQVGLHEFVNLALEV